MFAAVFFILLFRSRTSLSLQDRAANDLFQDANYSVKWSVDNEFDIVVVAVYQRVLTLSYVDDLLSRCKAAFVEVLRGLAPGARDDLHPLKAFTNTFASLQAEIEAKALEDRKAAVKKPRSFSESKKFANTKAGNKASCAVGGGSKPSEEKPAAETGAAPEEDAADEEAKSGELTKEQIAANIAKMKGGGGPPRKKKGGEDGEGKKGKEKRNWDGEENPTPKNLDFSDSKGKPAASKVQVFKGKKVDLDEQFGGDDDDDEEEDDDEPAPSKANGTVAKKAASGGGGMFSALKSLVGQKALERSDLDSVLESLHNKLTEKNVAQVSSKHSSRQLPSPTLLLTSPSNTGNVAQDIGAQICESVCTSLLGKQLGSFGSLRQTVRSAMESTLTRVLTPNKRVDLLAAATAARAEKRPYTIVFVGVNGVGKSTSLSKVAYYLKTNGFTPMLCACDTFRAGAVEQLRVHAQSLELPLFEKGYGRDAAGIATDGIKYAGQMGYAHLLFTSQQTSPLTFTSLPQVRCRDGRHRRPYAGQRAVNAIALKARHAQQSRPGAIRGRGSRRQRGRRPGARLQPGARRILGVARAAADRRHHAHKV